MPKTGVDVNTVGELLRAKRGGRSQRDVAARAGIDHSAVARFEGGKRMPSLPVLKRLADVLGFEEEDWALLDQLIPGAE